MASDASNEQKLILENIKNILRNLQVGAQAGVLLPSTVDEATRSPLFDLSLLSTEGSKKSFDIDKIKQYYRNQIFIGLFADILIMGSSGDSSGSFALGMLKNSLTGSAVESMLDNIVESFNRDVIRQLYELNGYNPARAAKLDYENLNTTDLETMSKAAQRYGATGYLPKTLDVVNKVMESLGIDPLSDNTTQEELDALLPDKTTRSGDGMEEGMPSGTGSASGEAGNASDVNSDNAA